MRTVEVDKNMIIVGDWKLHGALCKKLYTIVHEVLNAFPVLQAARPRNSSGIQALCSLQIAVEKANNLLQYCSECSKLYLALTADCVLTEFENAKHKLLESLHMVKETIPEAITTQIPEIVNELKKTAFALDQSEKQAGDELIRLTENGKTSKKLSLDSNELESFHQAALKAGIASSRTALAEVRALEELLEEACGEEDMRKEPVASYLLHLMRKYSNLFESETTDYNDLRCSSPCSSSSASSHLQGNNNNASETPLSKLSSCSLRRSMVLSESMPMAPVELRCPISLQLMHDPVVIASGQTYERACIEKWTNNGNLTCPKTRQQLSHLNMTPNYCIKGLIASWCEQNGIPIPSAPPESPRLDCLRLSTDGVDMVLSEETGAVSDAEADRGAGLEDKSHENYCQGAALERCEHWLRVLSKADGCVDEQRNVVEHIRLQLKDDDELRNYMSANGFTEPLVRYLKAAIRKGDEQSQEAGAMALFNLAVKNDRNKKLLLSAGVIPLLEEMIQKVETCEAATAIYLNLSCLSEAKAIIGSSEAVLFLVRCLQEDGSRSYTCRLDALLTLYNLSLHPPNIPPLIASGITRSLCAILTPCSAWADKALAVLINLALNRTGKKEIVSDPALLSAIVMILDNGQPAEKEKAVSCLWIICNNDEASSYTVLQEGVIPALVLLAASGTPRAMDKAQRLLRLFREQRQRELEQAQPEVELREAVNHAVAQQQQQQHDSEKPVETSDKRLGRSRSRGIGKALNCLLKNKRIFWIHS